MKTILNKINKSPVATRFLNGAGWSVLGTAVSQLIVMGAMLVVARSLGKEVYGKFILVQSTLGMVGVFAGFGVGGTVNHYIASLKNSNTNRLKKIISICERSALVSSLLIACILFFLSDFMAKKILNNYEMTIYLEIASGSVFFLALDSYYKSIIIGLEKIKKYAIANIIGVSAGSTVVIFGSLASGLDGVIYSIVISAAIQAAISWIMAKKELKVCSLYGGGDGCIVEWRVIRDFALPSMISGALVAPAHWICYSMLVRSSGGYGEVALLGIAMQWFSIVVYLPIVAGRVVAPMLSDYVNNKNDDSSKKLLLLSIKSNMIASVPVALVITLLSNGIIEMYGLEYISGAKIISTAVWVGVVMAIVSPVGNYISAHSKIWTGMTMNMGWALFYIGGGYFFVEKGAFGIVMGLGLAYAAHFFWSLCWVHGKLKQNLNT